VYRLNRVYRVTRIAHTPFDPYDSFSVKFVRLNVAKEITHFIKLNTL